jgi:hypothetical protein
MFALKETASFNLPALLHYLFGLHPSHENRILTLYCAENVNLIVFLRILSAAPHATTVENVLELVKRRRKCLLQKLNRHVKKCTNSIILMAYLPFKKLTAAHFLLWLHVVLLIGYREKLSDLHFQHKVLKHYRVKILFL